MHSREYEELLQEVKALKRQLGGTTLTGGGGTTSATIFKVRAGMGTAGTTTFNGQAAARRMGGVFASSMTITEYRP